MLEQLWDSLGLDFQHDAQLPYQLLFAPLGNPTVTLNPVPYHKKTKPIPLHPAIHQHQPHPNPIHPHQRNHQRTTLYKRHLLQVKIQD